MNQSPDWIAAITNTLVQAIGVFVGFFIDFLRQGLAAFLF